MDSTQGIQYWLIRLLDGWSELKCLRRHLFRYCQSCRVFNHASNQRDLTAVLFKTAEAWEQLEQIKMYSSTQTDKAFGERLIILWFESSKISDDELLALHAQSSSSFLSCFIFFFFFFVREKKVEWTWHPLTLHVLPISLNRAQNELYSWYNGPSTRSCVFCASFSPDSPGLSFLALVAVSSRPWDETFALSGVRCDFRSSPTEPEEIRTRSLHQHQQEEICFSTRVKGFCLNTSYRGRHHENKIQQKKKKKT
jgi:hypothetical protein